MTEPKIRTGQWMYVYGVATQVINVIDSRAFPGHALDVLVVTVEGVTTTLVVPASFEPLLIEGVYTPPVTNGALPRRPVEPASLDRL